MLLGRYDIKTPEDAAKAFGDHEAVNPETVITWCNQIGKNNQKLAIKILKNINYYSGNDIRYLGKQLIEKVCSTYSINSLKNLLIVPIGKPGEGSSIIARALRGIPDFGRLQIRHVRELVEAPKGSSIRAILLLDDFGGSGDKFRDWWSTVEPLLLPWAYSSVELVVGILVLNYKAQQVLKSLKLNSINAILLTAQYNVLSSESNFFKKKEKIIIEALCKKTGCGSEYLRGYKECGLLVAFKHSCPNDSLPILWYSSKHWKALFMRRAI